MTCKSFTAPSPLLMFCEHVIERTQGRAGWYFPVRALSERQFSIWQWGWETKQRSRLGM